MENVDPKFYPGTAGSRGHTADKESEEVAEQLPGPKKMVAYRITVDKIMPPDGAKTYENKEEVYSQRVESLDVSALVVFINGGSINLPAYE